MSRGRPIKWTPEKVITAIQRYATLLGETPSANRLDRDHRHLDWLPPHRQIEFTLGCGWNEAMERAGLEPRYGVGRPKQ